MSTIRKWWRRKRSRCPNCARPFGDEFKCDGQRFCMECAATYDLCYTECGEVHRMEWPSWV